MQKLFPIFQRYILWSFSG